MTIEERVRYYLTPKWYSYFMKSMENNQSNIYINYSLFTSDTSKIARDHYSLISEEMLKDHRRENKCGVCYCRNYCDDALDLMRSPAMKKCKYHNSSNRYVMQFGDRKLNVSNYPSIIPVFKKARSMNEENVILLSLHANRHFGFFSDVDKYDIPWKAKNKTILWRGTMTGFHGHARFSVVNKYFKYFEKRNLMNVTVDIAFTEKNQNYELWKKAGMNAGGLLRKRISMEEILQSKYLVSIAGNDVGTNFAPILYSNSVPFLFRLPLEESEYESEAWMMHALLKPYIHYIPFTADSDADDSLMKAFEFCESHPKNCSQIAQNGKQWMKQFKDKEREEEIQTKILVLYCHSVHVI